MLEKTQILLISSDSQLHLLCRDVLGDSLGTSCELKVHQSNGSLPESDLTIWDFHPDLAIPAGVVEQDQHKHLFILQRKHVPALRTRLGQHNARLLLKPVTRAALVAFIEQYIGRPGTNGGHAGTLRAERDEMLQSLMITNLRLQEYDQDRTTFLTRAIHDFRAPLTALTGYCGLLLAEQLGPVNEEQKDVLSRMLHSAKRLSRMANAMFQLGVGPHKETDGLALRPGDLQDCIDQAVHELAHIIQEKHLVVSAEVSAAPEELYFDAGQLEQVFVNLLDNACRFTPKHGSIEIQAYPFFWERRMRDWRDGARADRRSIENRTPNSMRVDISDSGPGIAVEHLDKIFEEYTSYSGGQDRSGGGLGLAICKMILNRHQGRIWAATKTTGAMFSFVLPFRRTD